MSSAVGIPRLYPNTTEAKQLRAIHPERLNCCLAGWCQTDNFRASFVPGKVRFPLLLLGMKQGDGLTEERRNGRLSMGFITVTGGTRQTQIFQDSFTTRLAGDDVLDFEDGYGERLGCPPIGTTIYKPRPDLTPQCGRDVGIEPPHGYSQGIPGTTLRRRSWVVPTPACSMLMAAFTSRSCADPQSAHVHCLTFKPA
jgi:hypothetical protein